MKRDGAIRGTGIFLTAGTASKGPAPKTRIAAYRARLHREKVARINRFADLLSEGWTISAAAREVGVSQQAGSSMLKDICAALGPQAV